MRKPAGSYTMVKVEHKRRRILPDKLNVKEPPLHVSLMHHVRRKIEEQEEVGARI